MKYINDASFVGGWRPRFEQENPNTVPLRKPVWAFAYKIDNETGYKHLSCEPELGEVVKSDIEFIKHYKVPTFARRVFVPYKKNSNSFKKSGIVNAEARYYADTYEEAVEGYNSLVANRINRLDEMKKECMEDML